jgi:hypothetical protein
MPPGAYCAERRACNAPDGLQVIRSPGIVHVQSPSRPFESLDWFREANRREYRSGNAGYQALRWLMSSRCFAFHIGLFALGTTLALAVNVAREPAHIWVDGMALAWALLLVIHAVVVSLIFAIGLLGTSEERLPVYVPQYGPGPTTRPAPTAQAQAPEWPTPPSRAASPAPRQAQPQPARPVTASQPSGTGQWAQPPSTPPEAGWPTATMARGSETASWREASPAAWLRRKRDRPVTPDTPNRSQDGTPADES